LVVFWRVSGPLLAAGDAIRPSHLVGESLARCVYGRTFLQKQDYALP